jgi:hypothetical protein
LESQDQDGRLLSISLTSLPLCLGMTGIDMALTSGYKSLASRIAQWTYVDTRTMVGPLATLNPHLFEQKLLGLLSPQPLA